LRIEFVAGFFQLLGEGINAGLAANFTN